MFNTQFFHSLSEISKVTQMSDVELLHFVKGPLFELTLMIFVFGLVFKITRILILGVPKNKAKSKGSPTFSAIKMIVMKPIYVFGFKDVLTKRTITFINGYIFHISFILLIFFIPWHSYVWDSLFGIKLPYFSAIVSNILAYSALTTIILLWFSRMASPVTRLLAGKDEHIAAFLIVLALITGIIANKWAGAGNYASILTIHILSAELLIIYMPFSRLSHFITYFISTIFYGRSVGISGARG